MRLPLSRLDEVCIQIAQMLPHGGVVVLQGDLSSGKTTLVQAFGRYLGVVDAITSPTFAIQQVYEGRLFHYDIYTQGSEHFLAMGLMEELEREGYHWIEWGDASLELWLRRAHIPYVRIRITPDGEERCYEVEMHA